MLQVQGERTGGAAGVALLDRSVAAYEAALRVYTETASPIQWAATQNNLGNVLQVQGERTGGAAGVALLDRSAAAYEAALRVRTETASPVEWA
ncbi:hypothetical protein [Novosphingobium beihaiensis]|uniref:Tetratricopeptide repeat protein n=1 Tax=Novosphingobium beihaiensis TaxID=2930389 RepID=A0ABT0BX57_9SPHN|nr:hypothetical protein [Novosphingobium beihaiensis]MCJ2189269.1 hypothetical protein [Novosphingobium beihaiensis]